MSKPKTFVVAVIHFLSQLRHEKTHTSGSTCDRCQRWFENDDLMKTHRCKKSSKRKKNLQTSDEKSGPSEMTSSCSDKTNPDQSEPIYTDLTVSKVLSNSADVTVASSREDVTARDE